MKNSLGLASPPTITAKSRLRLLALVAVTMSIAVLVAFASLGRGNAFQQRDPRHEPDATQIPPYHESVEAAMPFPEILAPANSDGGSESEAYRIAAAIPEVLAQQPCYCRCSRRLGHKSLLDCYASDHGVKCEICLKEALFAGRMTESGKSPKEIREAIIRGDWISVELTR